MGLNIPHCKFPKARVGIWEFTMGDI